VLPQKPDVPMGLRESFVYGQNIKSLPAAKKPAGFPVQYIQGKDLPIGPKLVALASYAGAKKADETVKILNSAAEDTSPVTKGSDWKCYVDKPDKTQEEKAVVTAGDFVKMCILPRLAAK
jgi:hypothetical protein